MTSKTVFDRVEGTLGTLVNGEYKYFPVTLDIEVKQLPGQHGGPDDEAVLRSVLARRSSVPDGSPYTLRYTYHGKPYEFVGLRVSGGILLNG